MGALDPHKLKSISGQGATDLGAVLSMFDTKNDQDAANQGWFFKMLLIFVICKYILI